MKNRRNLCWGLVLVALVSLNFTTGTPRSLPAGGPEDERAIRTHIDHIFQAYIAKDKVQVKNLHAPNWRGFLTYSRKVLRGIDDYMAAAESQGGLDKQITRHLVRYKMLDYDIIFHEQTGIVTYITELYWEDGAAKGAYQLRSMDIYGKEQGQWTQLASNICALPVEKNDPQPVQTEQYKDQWQENH
jgi:hypothetical protein